MFDYYYLNGYFTLIFVSEEQCRLQWTLPFYFNFRKIIGRICHCVILLHSVITFFGIDVDFLLCELIR